MPMKPGLKIFFFLFFTSWTSISYSQNILGVSYACLRDCYIYQLKSNSDQIIIPESWHVTDPSGTPVSFELIENGTAIRVCFGSMGDFTIRAVQASTIIEKIVNVGFFTELPLIVNIPGCKPFRPSECIDICPGMTLTIGIEGLQIATLRWEDYNIIQGFRTIDESNLHITLEAFDKPGFYYLVYVGYTENQCPLEGSICLRIVEEPEAGFTGNFPIVNDTMTICRNQEIILQNTSNSKNVNWTEENGTTINNRNLKKSFTQAGVYKFTQRVSNLDCQCEAIKPIWINVLDEPGPNLYCIGTVCQGDTITYQTDQDCSPYNWIISPNGQIIAGGQPEDDFVRIYWINGNVGNISITHQCNLNCPFPTTIEIPLIGNENKIVGQILVCADTDYPYYLDELGGTSFKWEIVPNSSQVIKGQGTDQISVNFYPFVQNQQVIVKYENCHLECSGTDTLNVTIKNRFKVEGPLNLCHGEPANWTSLNVLNNNPVNTKWEILDHNNQILFTSPGEVSSFDWPDILPAGSYTLQSLLNNTTFCNNKISRRIEIKAKPSSPSNIIGPDQICPGELYTFTVNPHDNALKYHWQIDENGNLSTLNEYPLKYLFGDHSQYTIKVQAVDPRNSCASDTTELQIDRLTNLIIDETGADCQFSEATFKIEGNQIDKIIWTVDNLNIANLLEYPDGQSARYKWLNPGNVQITASYCGLVTQINQTISGIFEPTVIHPTHVCNNEKVLVTTVDTYKSYKWMSGSSLLCTTESCLLGAGQYIVIVEDSLGCTGRKTFIIEQHAVPNINIYAPNGVGFCVGDSAVLVSTWIDSPEFEYTWYYNGVPMPETAHTIYVKNFGTYTRRITNTLNGCFAISPPIEFCEFCGPGFCFSCPCGGSFECDDSPLASAQITRTARCNEFEFEILTPGIVPGSIRWYLTAPNGTTTLQTQHTFTLQLSQAGYYLVSLFVKYIDGNGDTLSPCPTIFNLEVVAVADFSYTTSCLNQPTQFLNATSLLGLTQITQFAWEFGDPAMGTSALPNPSYTYSSSGIYDVVFRIDTDQGCFVDVTKPVNIIQPAPINLQFDPEICLHDYLNPILDEQNILLFEWYFDLDNHPNQIMDLKNPARHGYDVPGIYRFGIEVLDIYGCRSAHTEFVQVHDLPDPGIIQSDKAFPLCEGDTVILSATSSGPTYLWSTGSTDPSISVTKSNRFNLTITDVNGCSSQTEPIHALFYSLPDSSVLMVSGSKSVFSPDTLIVCAGSSVQLIAIAPNNETSYLWSNNEQQREILFDGVQLPLLNEGLHQFTVEITNNTTGCKSTNNSIFIRVVQNPDIPLLDADQPHPLCSPNLITISVSNYNPSFEYTWNNDLLGPNIITSNPGAYSVTAQNNHGCKSQSLPQIIYGPPSMNFLPEGCYEACEADTVCLPPRSNFTIIEWLFDGNSLNPQPSDMNSPILSQSGTYSAIIQTIEGCIYETATFDYQIFPGLGAVGGIVFEDVDLDSIFGSGDNLLNGIRVIISGMGVHDTLYTNSAGEYYFKKLPLGTYIIRVDNTSLPPGLAAVPDSFQLEINDCFEEILGFGLPTNSCTTDTTFYDYQICYAEIIEIHGIEYVFEKDSIINIEYTVQGCPYIDVFEIKIFPQDSILQNVLSACDGEFIEIDGTPFLRDTSLQILYQNINGCDSTVNYTLIFKSLPQEEVNLGYCPGISIEYKGISISRDTFFEIREMSTIGDCDTIYTISAKAHVLEPYTVTSISTCSGKNEGLILIESNEVFNLTLNGQFQGNSSFLSNLSSGIYALELYDKNNCKRVEIIEIEEREQLIAMVPDVLIACGESVELHIEILSGIDSTLQIQWQNGQTTDRIQVNRPGTYLVEVQNSCQRVSLKGRALDLDEGGKSPYFVPSAFTPNGDDINDDFRPLWADDVQIESYLFEIFDRWGNLQFRSDDPMASWEGLVKDRQDKIAVYVWKLDAVIIKCNERQIIKDKGDVTMFR
jgi:gliding motility-associated-like protein